MFSVKKFEDEDKTGWVVVESPNQYAAVFKTEKNYLKNIQIYDGKTGELAAECDLMPNNRMMMQGTGETNFGGAFSRLSGTRSLLAVDRHYSDHSHIYLKGMDGNCALELSWDQHGLRAYVTEDGSQTVGELTFSQNLKCTGYMPRGGSETQMTTSRDMTENRWIQAAEDHLEENLFPEAITLEQKAKVLDRAGKHRQGLLSQLVAAAEKADVKLSKDVITAQRNAIERDRLAAHKKLVQNKMKRTVKDR